MKKLLHFLFLVFCLAACRSYGDSIAINNKSKVYFKGNVKEEEAKKLGDFLLLQGYFNTSDERTVQLVKRGKAYIVRFIVEEDEINADRENIVFSFEVWREWIKEHVFQNQIVHVELVNEKLKRIAKVGQIKE